MNAVIPTSSGWFSTRSSLRVGGTKTQKRFAAKSAAANSRRPELVADYWSPGWKSNGRNMVASATEIGAPAATAARARAVQGRTPPTLSGVHRVESAPADWSV